MKKRYGKYGWSKGVLLNLAIGQGELLVTPLQVLNYTNLLATRGQAPNCHFVYVDNLPSNFSLNLKDEIWDNVHNGMRDAIKTKTGTGKRADLNVEGFNLFGKTGTAENPHGDDHAWFIGWIGFENNLYSVVVLMENAGSGGTKAAPVAKQVFRSIYKNTRKQKRL